MASECTMRDPICLVENQNNQLTVNPTALEILDKISQPVVVVAVTGLYRTGKSYLMNRLAGQNHGFRLGSTVRSETKGIWMWCVPHPFKPNHTLLLLDTEGLGDVEKGDSKNDSWIFALAVLLSSVLVYNSMSTINHQALEQLHYVTELTKLIRTKSSPSSGEVDDSAEFVSFFPDFVWVVRDFMLELKLDGQTITEDEYLENALKLLTGKDPRIQQSNMPRENIRKFFPKRKCFVFDRPTNDKNLLSQMNRVQENQLECSFQEQSKNFCNYIFTDAKTKTLREGISVTGNRLGTLTKAYVDAINSGAVPCLENAVTILAERENSAAVQMAADHYSEQMAQRVSFPTDTLQELLDVHSACEKEAIAIFMEHSILDEKQGFQEKLMDIIEKKKENVLLQNEEESVKYCQAQLSQLSKPLTKGIFRGTFSVPGGYILYCKEIDKVKQSYNLVSRKGVKAMEVLQSFLESQAATKKSIFVTDKALTAGKKALEAEQAKTKAVEKEKEVLRQTLNEKQQKMEDQERSFKQNMDQMKKKMRETENKLTEQVKKIEKKHKLKEENMKAEIAVQHIKLQFAEATVKMLEEEQKKNEQKMKEKEKSYQEQLKQMTEKMEKERAKVMAEKERILNLKFQNIQERSDEMKENMKKGNEDQLGELVRNLMDALNADKIKKRKKKDEFKVLVRLESVEAKMKTLEEKQESEEKKKIEQENERLRKENRELQEAIKKLKPEESNCTIS